MLTFLSAAKYLMFIILISYNTQYTVLRLLFSSSAPSFISLLFPYKVCFLKKYLCSMIFWKYFQLVYEKAGKTTECDKKKSKAAKEVKICMSTKKHQENY